MSSGQRKMWDDIEELQQIVDQKRPIPRRFASDDTSLKWVSPKAWEAYKEEIPAEFERFQKEVAFATKEKLLRHEEYLKWKLVELQKEIGNSDRKLLANSSERAYDPNYPDLEGFA